MSERTYTSAAGYRFGFGGQEKDDEISGNGNSYTAEFWQYDSRLGRRWNVDPVVKPWESSYATFANNPIYYNDPNGEDAEDDKNKAPEKQGKKDDMNGGWYWNKDSDEYNQAEGTETKGDKYSTKTDKNGNVHVKKEIIIGHKLVVKKQNQQQL